MVNGMFKFFKLIGIMALWAAWEIMAVQDSTVGTAARSDYQAYRTQQRAEYTRFRALSQSEFNAWQADDEKKFKAFKKQITREWGDYVESTDKAWVEYGDSTTSRSVVDFKKGVVTIEVLVGKARAALPVVKDKLEKAVEQAITSRGTTSPETLSPGGPKESVLAEPVLTNQVADRTGAIVSPQSAATFARQITDSVVPQESAAGDPRFEKYILSFPLVPDHLARRMAPFVTFVKKYCLQYDLNFAQVLAMIHTESYFNPMAHSASNAIGLMQLVPEKGAREAYQFVSSSADAAAVTVAQESLFDPETNVHLGCAYLYLLKTRDFGDVTNKDCSMYCSIASYNGGPACVAYAFTGYNRMQPAIRTINSMNDGERVYLFLVRNLPSAETRQYLENVVQRIRLYE
jgi:membrane-bound lytic murein transglycosylase C